MSETAQELVERMAAAGAWPEPALLDAIIAKGEEAVAPLLEVIRREAKGWPAEAPVYHALGLLTHLPRSEAVLPVVLDIFRRYEHEMLEILPDVLVPYGDVVIEPLLEVIRDRKLHWYCCAVASGIALHVAFADAKRFAEVKAVLREELSFLVSRREELKENDYSRGSSLIIDLSDAADPEARPLIAAALEAGCTEMYGEKDVEDAYRQGPRARTHIEKSWIDSYRKHYRTHLESEARRAAPKPPPIIPGARSAPAPPLTSRKEPALPIARPLSSPQRKVGRNDPCWCGSGKKYKNCHLHKDQE